MVSIHHSNQRTMTTSTCALFFMCLFVPHAASESASEDSSSHFKFVSVGENVTLPCMCQDDSVKMLYWFKQTFGQAPQLMSTSYIGQRPIFQDQFKDDPRFSIDYTDKKYDLKISSFRDEDSGAYFCMGNTLDEVHFCESTTVNVKDLDSDITAIVHQSVSEKTPSENNQNLSCAVQPGTCEGEHNVYWFRNSEHSHPGLIYTQGGRKDQCVRKHDPMTHTCVYNLPMKDSNTPHEGSDHCAVASCGRILFGEETKPDKKGDPLNLVYILSTAVVITTILIASLALSLYKMKNRKYQCPAADSSPDAQISQDADALHYAALRVQRVKRSTRPIESTRQECVYSRVKL